MNAWWIAQSERINSLSLRERVFLFLSVIACVLALADVMWLEPAQSEHKQLTQRFEKQNAQLKQLRTEVKAGAKPDDPVQSTGNALTQAQARLTALDNEIRQVSVPSGSATSSTPLTQALVQFLKRHDGLTLVRTTALPMDAAQGVPGTPAAPGAALAPALQAVAASGLNRQGVELVVAGAYPDLLRYVQSLEKALPTLRWGAMQLSSGQGQTQLSLQVYVVGAPL
jgi:MSHA biogenesis protein MshJ